MVDSKVIEDRAGAPASTAETSAGEAEAAPKRKPALAPAALVEKASAVLLDA